jgi:hypothetical protein
MVSRSHGTSLVERDQFGDMEVIYEVSNSENDDVLLKVPQPS